MFNKKKIEALEAKIENLQAGQEKILKHIENLADALIYQTDINNQLMNMFGMIGGNINGTH